MEPSKEMIRLRAAARVFYDLQMLRIGTDNRARAEDENTDLAPEDQQFLGSIGDGLGKLEDQAAKHMADALEGISIANWLQQQRGIGTTLAAVIVSFIDIEKASTVSKLWSYCGVGLKPANGGYAIQRRRKGEKISYNPFLKTKLLGVAADTMIKAVSTDERGYHITKSVKYKPEWPTRVAGEGTEAQVDGDWHPVVVTDTRVTVRVRVPLTEAEARWRKVYDDRKHRRRNQIMPQCMGCNGKGTRAKECSECGDKGCDVCRTAKPTSVQCSNCGGTGGPAPWGRSDAHRNNDARRYMIKMFLQQLYIEWRTREGLEVRPPYQEEKLGHQHAV